MKNLYSYSRILVFNLLLLFSFISFAQTDPPENFYVTPVGMASWDSITSNDFQFYKVFLDGVFITDTDSSTYSYASNSEELIAGESYLAEISALYNDGLSEKTNFEFVYLPCDSFPAWSFFNAYAIAGSENAQLSWTDNLMFIPIEENFESGGLPNGWSMYTNSATGWSITSNGSSSNWEIPEGNAYYACSNDDAANDDGSMDYLITPEMNFVGLSEIQLSFSSFLNGAYGQSGTVEISLDGGYNWIVLEDTENNDDWIEIQVDLSAYAGEASAKIAFHSNDNGEWASGWAIDNVSITASKSAKTNSTIIGTNIYRNGELIDFVATPDTFYLDLNLSPGFYDYCVSKVYSDDEGSHSWTSCPETNCAYNILFEEDCMTPQPSIENHPQNPYVIIFNFQLSKPNDKNTQELLGFNLYRDYMLLNETLITSTYYDTLPGPGTYSYYAIAIYSICGESEPSNEYVIMIGNQIGMEEYAKNFQINPNPANDFLKIDCSGVIKSVYIYNSAGHIMSRTRPQNSSQMTINTANWNSGMYFIEIQTNQGVQRSKIMIQH